jgi:hypothetical protein
VSTFVIIVRHRTLKGERQLGPIAYRRLVGVVVVVVVVSLIVIVSAAVGAGADGNVRRRLPAGDDDPLLADPDTAREAARLLIGGFWRSKIMPRCTKRQMM